MAHRFLIENAAADTEGPWTKVNSWDHKIVNMYGTWDNAAVQLEYRYDNDDSVNPISSSEYFFVNDDWQELFSARERYSSPIFIRCRILGGGLSTDITVEVV